MRDPKQLTRADILSAASNFKWNRKGMKWTVIVGNRELPARSLVLDAAGAPPNDPVNSHQAVEILERLGFETRYRKGPKDPEGESAGSGDPGTAESLLEMVSCVRERIPEQEWERIPSDLSKNLDHYLYGAEKTEK